MASGPHFRRSCTELDWTRESGFRRRPAPRQRRRNTCSGSNCLGSNRTPSPSRSGRTASSSSVPRRNRNIRIGRRVFRRTIGRAVRSDLQAAVGCRSGAFNSEMELGVLQVRVARRRSVNVEGIMPKLCAGSDRVDWLCWRRHPRRAACSRLGCNAVSATHGHRQDVPEMPLHSVNLIHPNNPEVVSRYFDTRMFEPWTTVETGKM